MVSNGGDRSSVRLRVSDIVFTNQNLDAGGKLVLGAVCGSEHVLGADDAASAPRGKLSSGHQADLSIVLKSQKSLKVLMQFLTKLFLCLI